MSKYDFTELEKNVKAGIYQLLGKGSSRKVVDIGNGKVLKIAFNEKGISQNEAEVEIFNSDNSDYYELGLFAKIYDYSSNYKYVIMEKCSKTRSIKHVKQMLADMEICNSLDDGFNDILQELESRYDLPKTGDNARKSSWGITENGKCVLVDYGCTYNVWQNHYSYEARQKAKNNRYAYNW
jgi:hypothetical protein